MIFNFQLTFIYLIIIGLIYYHSIFLYKNVVILTHYGFNEKIFWNKLIERPRIFLHLISLGLIWIVFNSDETNNTFQSTFKLIMYFAALLVLIFSYSSLFKKHISVKISPPLKITPQSNIKKNERNLIEIKETDCKTLFNNLLNFDLCEEKTTFEDFKEALLFNNTSKVYLKLDNSGIVIFHNLLRKHFKLSLNLKEFILSNSFQKKNNEPYNYNSIKSYKSPYPKYEDNLKKSFEKLF